MGTTRTKKAPLGHDPFADFAGIDFFEIIEPVKRKTAAKMPAKRNGTAPLAPLAPPLPSGELKPLSKTTDAENNVFDLLNHLEKTSEDEAEAVPFSIDSQILQDLIPLPLTDELNQTDLIESGKKSPEKPLAETEPPAPIPTLPELRESEDKQETPTLDAQPTPVLVEVEQHLLITLSGVEYVLPLSFVREISYLPDLTIVPNVPAWMLGVANMRGTIVPVVDLHLHLNLPYKGDLSERRLIVIEDEEQTFTLGFIISKVSRIVNLAPDQIAPSSTRVAAQIKPFVSKEFLQDDQQTIPILDLDKLLQDPRLRIFEG